VSQRLPIFAERGDKSQIEEGDQLSPQFDQNGLISVVTTDHKSGAVLMQAFMNAEALFKTIELGEAVYYSRSRGKLWRKGEESGHIQKVHEILTDCDQDCIWLRVEQVGNASCHVGYRSCFYRRIATSKKMGQPLSLRFTETEKVFDPKEVYRKKKP